ncbi:hypothetical protein ACIA5C_08550 [Actinoplanes sp. NPDC051343]|uniref:hypothetical protein n=1 Tax=Actinoplanes sp. NPDC051343 TaxID=3363906 RepID=UPI0037932E60
MTSPLNATRYPALKERLAAADRTTAELTDFRSQALARLAAQHDEIRRLHVDGTPDNVRRLPSRTQIIGPCQ